MYWNKKYDLVEINWALERQELLAYKKNSNNYYINLFFLSHLILF